MSVGSGCETRTLIPLPLRAKHMTDIQYTKYLPEQRFQDTKQLTGMSSNSSGREG